MATMWPFWVLLIAGTGSFALIPVMVLFFHWVDRRMQNLYRVIGAEAYLDRSVIPLLSAITGALLSIVIADVVTNSGRMSNADFVMALIAIFLAVVVPTLYTWLIVRRKGIDISASIFLLERHYSSKHKKVLIRQIKAALKTVRKKRCSHAVFVGAIIAIIVLTVVLAYFSHRFQPEAGRAVVLIFGIIVVAVLLRILLRSRGIDLEEAQLNKWLQQTKDVPALEVLTKADLDEVVRNLFKEAGLIN